MKDDEHYVTAMTNERYELTIACRCGWLYSGNSSLTKEMWAEHKHRDRTKAEEQARNAD